MSESKEVQMTDGTLVKVIHELTMAEAMLDSVRRQAEEVTDERHRNIFLRKIALMNTKIEEALLWGKDLWADIEAAPHEYD